MTETLSIGLTKLLRKAQWLTSGHNSATLRTGPNLGMK